MPIVAKLAEDTADAAGDAVFMFPDVPVGELWSGTTTIPLAPATALSVVTTGGQLVGSMQGPGVGGPWTVDYSSPLAIQTSGLTPGHQYVAVWHADTKAALFSTYPSSITTAVVGTVSVPQPIEVEGEVTALQGAPPWEVDIENTVSVQPVLADLVTSGQRTVSQGVALQGPNLPATEGVIVSARYDNLSLVGIGGNAAVTGVTGLMLNPGQMTPLLPVSNASVLWVAGNNNSDVVSFLVI